MNNKIDEILDEMDEVLDKAKPFPFAGNKFLRLMQIECENLLMMLD